MRYIIGALILVPLLIVLLSFQSGRVKSFRIVSGSMEPTLLVGDCIFVTGGGHDPERGEVVVFRNPNSPQELLVKRAIGIPGDTVSVKGCKISVNSELIKDAKCLNLEDSENKIKKGKYFVLGDNVENSYDSFDFGPVSVSDTVGRATFIYWPLSRIGKIH